MWIFLANMSGLPFLCNCSFIAHFLWDTVACHRDSRPLTQSPHNNVPRPTPQSNSCQLSLLFRTCLHCRQQLHLSGNIASWPWTVRYRSPATRLATGAIPSNHWQSHLAGRHRNVQRPARIFWRCSGEGWSAVCACALLSAGQTSTVGSSNCKFRLFLSHVFVFWKFFFVKLSQTPNFRTFLTRVFSKWQKADGFFRPKFYDER